MYHVIVSGDFVYRASLMKAFMCDNLNFTLLFRYIAKPIVCRNKLCTSVKLIYISRFITSYFITLYYFITSYSSGVIPVALDRFRKVKHLNLCKIKYKIKLNIKNKSLRKR